MPKTQRRRRREGKTDYKARLSMLKSEVPRLVVRRTNRYMIAQLVESATAQDKTILRVSSKDLLTNGWPKDKQGSLKGMVAAYLTGFLLVRKLKDQPKKVILDTGLQRTLPGSRIFATLKGAIDAGLKIPYNKEALPTDERLKSNEKTASLIKLKEKL